MKTVAITGANGFLGSALVEHYTAAGYTVRKFVRIPRDEQSYSFDLEHGVKAGALQGVDILIHAAHDFTPINTEEMHRVNREGSRKLFVQASHAGVRVILFVSSVSAFPGSFSVYGKTKFETEAIVEEYKGKSVRPGLIYGRDGKGMFGSLEKVVQKLPIVPLFDGGAQQMVLAHVDDLSSAILWVTEHWEEVPSVSTLAATPPVTFRRILEMIAEKNGKVVHFVSVPSILALFGLRFFEKIGIRVPFRSDSLVSLLNTDPELGNLRLRTVSMRSLEDASGGR